MVIVVKPLSRGEDRPRSQEKPAAKVAVSAINDNKLRGQVYTLHIKLLAWGYDTSTANRVRRGLVPRHEPGVRSGE